MPPALANLAFGLRRRGTPRLKGTYLLLLRLRTELAALRVGRLGSFTFALGMLNVSGIVMAMIVGSLLVVAMVLPRWVRPQLWRRFMRRMPSVATR